jgi:hypothetical protein
MDKNVKNAKQAMSSATSLLAVQWIIAIISIPSAMDYQRKLDDGIAADQISTIYDNFSIAVTIALVWSWLSTIRYLTGIYDQEIQINPNSMRLTRGWVTWSWIVPVVSFWFPKRIVDDLLASKFKRSRAGAVIFRVTGTWWVTWISYVLLNDITTINTILGNATRIQPTYEIAAACMLTASYTVWTKILRSLATDPLTEQTPNLSSI